MPPNPQRQENKQQKHSLSTFQKSSTSTRTQKPTEVTPDFTKKCHFTIQLYPCGHKTWLNKPRITHMRPCCILSHLADPLTSIPSSETKNKEQGGNKFSKTRCTNMASRPREIHMSEICASCKMFVFDFSGTGEKEGVSVNQGVSIKEDFGLDDIQKGIARLRISATEKNKEYIEKDAERNSKIRPEEPDRDIEAQKLADKLFPSVHRAENNSTQSVPDTSPAKVKKEEQPSKTEKEEMGIKATKATEATSILGSFVNLFKATPKIPEIENLEDDEPIEIWTEVDEDPDWDKIDGKHEEQGSPKSESHDELWVKVKRG